MPAFGTDGILEAADIRDVTAHLLVLGGREPVTGDAGLGGEIYADQCAVCHGEGGEGMRDLGAPALADAIWLYGSDPDSIMAQVRQPSHGVMPAWGARLGDTVVKQLTLYVHSLGGGRIARQCDDPGRRARASRCFRGRASPQGPALCAAGPHPSQACARGLPPAEVVDHGGHARHLLRHALAALGPGPARVGPGGPGRPCQPAFLLLLHRDLAARVLLRGRSADHGRHRAVPGHLDGGPRLVRLRLSPDRLGRPVPGDRTVLRG